MRQLSIEPVGQGEMQSMHKLHLVAVCVFMLVDFQNDLELFVQANGKMKK